MWVMHYIYKYMHNDNGLNILSDRDSARIKTLWKTVGNIYSIISIHLLILNNKNKSYVNITYSWSPIFLVLSLDYVK